MRDRRLDAIASLRPWVIFGGCVTIVAVLYWARPVLMPVTLAALLTFVLNPAVSWLGRGIGRIAATVVVVTLVTGGLVAGSWVAVRQVAALVEDLPEYRTTIRHKVADVRGASTHGPVGKLQAAIDDIQTDIEGKPVKPPTPVVVGEPSGLLGMPAWITPLFDPLATAGLVIVLMTFMLVEWQELRNRLIRLIGQGDVARTTRAFSEAGSKVLGQLRMQLLVNVIYGVALGLALFVIGVPYALLWASLAAALRFVPYVGPFVGAAGPLFTSLAVFPGWTATMWVLGAIVVLELFTNVVLETVLYAGTGGVSQSALLVGIAFWTWIWGPIGLLMATPLTVCLVVLGKHLRPLRLLGTLMEETPSVSSDRGFYQRVVAGDRAGASGQVDALLRAESPADVFDHLLVPALASAERDLWRGRLSDADYRGLIETVDGFVGSVGSVGSAGSVGSVGSAGSVGSVSSVINSSLQLSSRSLEILACASSTDSEAAALRMLAALLKDTPVRLTIRVASPSAADLASAVRTRPYAAVVIAELAPVVSARPRYLVKRVRAAAPRVPILVVRLSQSEPAPRHLIARLRGAGALDVTTSLTDTAARLVRLAADDRRSVA